MRRAHQSYGYIVLGEGTNWLVAEIKAPNIVRQLDPAFCRWVTVPDEQALPKMILRLLEEAFQYIICPRMGHTPFHLRWAAKRL